MGFKPITTVHCLIRERVNAKITCTTCGRAVVVSGEGLRQQVHKQRIVPNLSDVAAKCRCKACGGRTARIEPTTKI